MVDLCAVRLTASKLGLIDEAPHGVLKRLRLFHGLLYEHIIFCIVGIAVCHLPILLQPQARFAAQLISAFFVVMLLARLAVRQCPDRKRALDLFSCAWVCMTVFNCAVFIIANHMHALVKDVPNAGVYALAVLTAVVPLYLRFNGISRSYRTVNNTAIALAYVLSPRWSAMEYHYSTLLMLAAISLGDRTGMYFALAPPSWLSLSFSASSTPAAAAPSDESVGDSVLDGTTQLWEGMALLPPPPPPADKLEGMLGVLAHGHLTFDDVSSERLYISHTFTASRKLHVRSTMAAITLCAFTLLPPATHAPLCGLVAAFIVILWRTWRGIERWRNVNLAHSTFCRAYTRFALLAGGIYFLLLLTTDEHNLMPNSPTEQTDELGCANMQLLELPQDLCVNSDGDGSSPLHGGSTSNALVVAVDFSGSLFCSMLLLLGTAHQRMLALTSTARHTTRLIILIGLIHSHAGSVETDGWPEANAAYDMVFELAAMAMGDAWGAYVDGARRVRFCQSLQRKNRETDSSTDGTPSSSHSDQLSHAGERVTDTSVDESDCTHATMGCNIESCKMGKSFNDAPYPVMLQSRIRPFPTQSFLS